MMRKLSLGELLKTAGAFTAVSAVTVDAGLLLAGRAGLLDVSGDWYINGPLLVWSAVGLTTTINLAGRLVRQAGQKPGQITGYSEGGPSPMFRAIGLNGGRAEILAHAVPFLFGGGEPGPEVYRPAAWRVPAGEVEVIIRESELRAFLDVAYRRGRHQFSRPYWTERRRPAMDRGRYDAIMRLLVESGLVDGRHAGGGASGRLVTKPHHAITFLKFESKFCVAR